MNSESTCSQDLGHALYQGMHLTMVVTPPTCRRSAWTHTQQMQTGTTTMRSLSGQMRVISRSRSKAWRREGSCSYRAA